MNQETKAVATLVNKWGLHARASYKLAAMAMKYSATITVTKGPVSADAKRMDELLLLIAEAGDTLEICADGDDGGEAVESIYGLIQSGFGENNG